MSRGTPRRIRRAPDSSERGTAHWQRGRRLLQHRKEVHSSPEVLRLLAVRSCGPQAAAATRPAVRLGVPPLDGGGGLTNRLGIGHASGARTALIGWVSCANVCFASVCEADMALLICARTHISIACRPTSAGLTSAGLPRQTKFGGRACLAIGGACADRLCALALRGEPSAAPGISGMSSSPSASPVPGVSPDERGGQRAVARGRRDIQERLRNTPCTPGNKMRCGSELRFPCCPGSTTGRRAVRAMRVPEEARGPPRHSATLRQELLDGNGRHETLECV